MKKVLTFAIVAMFFVFSYGQVPVPQMVLVKGGEFYMGNDYAPGQNSQDERPEHKVKLSSFYIGKYEVTFDEFDLFCEATGYPKPDDGGFGRGKHPVINISWEGAIKYCNWLSSRFGLQKVYDYVEDSLGMIIKKVNWSANGFRLPTEAEWEFAARGGIESKGYPFPGSTNLDDVAWYEDNSGGTTHPVGQKKPNELGLYDMLGNAFEWCWDYYDPNYYSHSPVDNPRGPATGKDRVYRGGCFKSPREYMRITKRFHFMPYKSQGTIGMRLACYNCKVVLDKYASGQK
jgi:formylglycine-generating enzyme required for sulfatase activity